MLLELEKRRGPRALLLRRLPRRAAPRRGLRDRAELTPMRLFLPRLSTRLRLYKCAVSPNPRRQHAHRRSLAAAAAGDSIPSAAYTVDGRAGLRNHALLVPVRGEGRIGFWAAITRLLTSDRLLPLRPRRLHHHHVHRRRTCRRRES